jgi:choice-of-anchor B domain-containing protein
MEVSLMRCLSRVGRGVLLVLCTLAASSAAAASASAQSTAFAATDAGRAGFGISLALTDAEVLVGEPASTARPGTVYVYRQSTAGWAEVAQLRAADAQPSDGFGSALAVADDLLVVGAAGRESDRGAAFIFQRTEAGWSQVAQLTPADLADGDRFGAAAAISAEVALVAAPGRAGRTGAVYIFERSRAGWSQTGKLAATTAAEQSLFGSSVVLSGARALVGMPGANHARGAVVVFDHDGAAWQETAVVSSPQAQPNDRFGAAIAYSDGVLLAGAPYASNQAGVVYAFHQNDQGSWVQAARLAGFDTSVNHRFGASLASDGAHVWAGAPTANGMRGMAYNIWRGADRQWAGALKLQPDLELIQGAQFGAAVAARGGVAAVGLTGDDHGAGSVAIFELQNGVWVQSSMLKSPPEALASVTGGEVRCSAQGSAAGFACSDVELLSFLSIPDLGGGRGVRLNDIWGWTDPVTGREYALVGRIDGTSFVDVSDPVNPVYVADLPKTADTPASSWRDIKVYRDHAYVVADGAGPHGMQVLDLTRLREFSGVPLELTPDVHYRRINSAHNIVINEESGFAYAVGASSGGETCGGGLHMIDIREPRNPQFVGCFSDPQTGRAATGYSHDAQCVIYRGPDGRYAGREICLGSNETALSIADVTDKSSPRALSRASYPNVAYSHQGWLSEDHRYFYMNDELDEISGVVDRTRTLIWDVADLEDPQLVGEHLGVEGASDHNLYIRGDLMYQSNYKSGLRILDITDRERPVEVAFFDTHPGGVTAGFEGTWSNYPFFDSGIIIVSSIGEGLFVLKKRDVQTVF